MNRLLAETLSILNGSIAVLIVLAGAYMAYQASSGSLIVIAAGAVLGGIVAALVCGVISYLALIEGHLAIIASQKQESRSSDQRREPSL